MSDNKVKDFTEIAFSFLSLKVKAIIIGVCLGFLIIVIIIFIAYHGIYDWYSVIFLISKR